MATRITVVLLIALALWPASRVAAVDLGGGQLAHIAQTAGNGVRLRAAPSLTAPTLTLLREGDEVRIVAGPTVAERHRWYRVKIGADTGWTVEDWLKAGAAPATTAPPPPPAIVLPTREGAPVQSGLVVGVSGVARSGGSSVTSSPTSTTASATPKAASATPTASATPMATATPTSAAAVTAVRSAFSIGSLVEVVNTAGRGLRLRDGASTNEPVRIAAVEGDALVVLAGPVLGDGLDWYRVRLGDTIGWAAAGWLAPVSAGATAAAPGRSATSTPTPRGNGQSTAAAPTKPTAEAAADSAGPAVAPSGQTKSEAVRLVPAGGDLGSRAARQALGFLGQDYQWGGVHPGAFDCEGLVWYVYRQLGIALPWGTWNQFSVGQRLDQSELRPGDLVFFRNTYAYGVTHVGLAIGSGQFVHALNEEAGVVVSSLDAPYWRAHYAGARRVIQE